MGFPSSFLGFLCCVVSFLSFSAPLDKHNSTSPRLFYIYDWPAEFADVYPPLSVILDNETSYDHQFNYNNGAGKLLLGDIGLFQTWQFSLFKVI